MPAPLPKTKVDEVLKLIRGGKSLLEASEISGVARPTIAGYCRKRGVATRRTGQRGPDRKSNRGGPGNRYVDRDGYVIVYAPDHPWPRRSTNVAEHVMVMELHLGRRIRRNECVHHKDEDRQNNDLSNLELKTRGAHSSEHRRKDVMYRTRDRLGRFAPGRIR
jgi:hypothetical protein